MSGEESKQTQVATEQARIGNLMINLSDQIGRLEQRINCCLRQEPSIPSAPGNKKSPSLVELASWLSVHAEDIQRQIIRIEDIINRCEL